MGYRRTDDLLLLTRANDDTSNTVVEDDNKVTDEEGDASVEERATDTNEWEKSELEPIWQRSLDGSEVALFFKPDSGTAVISWSLRKEYSTGYFRLFSNAKRHFNTASLWSKLMTPGYTEGYKLVQHRFHQMLNNLSTINAYGVAYVSNIPFEQWMKSYKKGLRYEHMTSNLAERINFIQMGTCHFSVTSVVNKTYFRLATLFLKRESMYARQIVGSGTFYVDVMKEIQ
ncbi:hypothetical protein PVK06_027236 [Gossypium arboreum]|uniref:Uncharacterized protein n=1 Tax=Gossypium arboreum TaxID=29729 RepID=A0ABR0P2B1_GOSAR|nr:hypothetical protein PVK06_027236 [Gossypium arboreum]